MDASLEAHNSFPSYIVRHRCNESHHDMANLYNDVIRSFELYHHISSRNSKAMSSQTFAMAIDKTNHIFKRVTCGRLNNLTRKKERVLRCQYIHSYDPGDIDEIILVNIVD